MNELEFGFLGGGQMATAIAKGVVHAKVAAPSALAFYEPSAEQVAKIKNLFPEASLASSASELFDRSHRLILAVKPQVLEGIAMGLAQHVTPHHHLISIAAGIPLAKLTQWFRTERFTRVMPNTPCQCLQGASGIAHSHGVSDQDKEWTDRVFRSVGTVVGVTDEQLHAVTGVSGSGPAYVLMMIEALSDGGVASGLSREVALKLATQTVLGAATMVQQTQVHPAILREQVTSPAGTTIEALKVLESGAFRSTVMQAVIAATNRSKELSGPIRKSESS
ncbi:MAG: pyrroline-5-carboxylate reductase [Planctomycetota bacterium]